MTHATPQNTVDVPRHNFYPGRFGRLFPHLKPWSQDGIPDSHLETHFLKFAKSSMVELPSMTPRQIANDPDIIKNLDGAFNSIIPAGYTYFGQFVDHDITHDVTTLGQATKDPHHLVNFRTPRLDLDSVYGRGPSEQPYLYQHGSGGFTGKLLLGNHIPDTDFLDLPRNREGRALIGDMRNEENAIVSQLQIAFIQSHNKLVDRVQDARNVDAFTAFKKARQTLCWLYQWVVWHDFLKRVTLPDVHSTALSKSPIVPGGTSNSWKLGLADIFGHQARSFMPVEFSVAAYRFGHSMVRNSYRTNSTDKAGFKEFIPLFDVSQPGASSDDLRGFRPLDKRRLVQWDWFLRMDTSSDPFPQHARKIDTKLSNALAALPENLESPGSIENVLAARNLVREVRMGLPSGQDIANDLGLQPLGLSEGEPDSLWFYILKEAEEKEDGNRLGELGSALVCSVFAGLLKNDATSWLNQNPDWTPGQDRFLDKSELTQDGGATLNSIIMLSDLPKSGGDLGTSTGPDQRREGGYGSGGGPSGGGHNLDILHRHRS